LLGDGDFLAVVDGFQTHFQAAYIGSYDSHLVLARLRERRRQSLLAEPLPDEEGAEPPADPAAGAPVAMRTVPPAAPTGDMQPNAGV